MNQYSEEILTLIRSILDNPKDFFSWNALRTKSEKLGLRLFVFDPPPKAMVLPSEKGIGLSEDVAKGPNANDVAGFWIIYANMKVGEVLAQLIGKDIIQWNLNDNLRSYSDAYGIPTNSNSSLHNEVFSLRSALEFWRKQKELNPDLRDEVIDILNLINNDGLLDAFVYIYWCDKRFIPDLRSNDLLSWRIENEEKLVNFFSRYVLFKKNQIPDFISVGHYGALSSALQLEEKGESVPYNINDFIDLGIETVGLLTSLNIQQAQELCEAFSQAVETFKSARNTPKEQTAGNDLARTGSKLFALAQKSAMECVVKGKGKVDRQQFDEATVFFKAAARLGEVTKSLRLEALGLHWLGITASRQHQYDSAVKYFEQSLAITINNELFVIASGSLDSLGIIETKRGEYESAISYFEAALKAAVSVRDIYGEASVLSNMSLALTSSGKIRQSRDCLLRAIKIADEIGEPRMKAAHLDNLGDVERVLGNYEEAVGHIQQAVDLYHQLDEPIDEYMALFNLASTYRHWGRFGDAEQAFLKANDILETLYSTIDIDKYRHVDDGYSAPRKWQEQQKQPRTPLAEDADEEALGKAFFERFGITIVDMAARERAEKAQEAFNKGDLDTALSLWLQAASEFKSIGYDIPLAKTLVNLSVTYSRLGDLDQAIACAENALGIYREANYISGEIASLINLYRALIKSDRSGSEQSGYMYLVRAARLTEMLPEIFDLSTEDIHADYLERKGIILTNRGNVAARFGASNLALNYYRQALELAEKTGNKYRICGRLTNLAVLYARLGDTNAFNDAIDKAYLIAQEENFLDVLLHCSSTRIEFLADSASPDELIGLAKEWLDLVERLRVEAPNTRLRTLIKKEVYPLYGLVLRVAKDTKNPHLVWDFIERIKARGVLDAVSTFRPVMPQPGLSNAELLIEEGELIQKRKELDQILFNPQIEDSDDFIRLKYKTSEERKEVVARLEEIWNQLSTQSPEALAWRKGTPITSDRIDKLLETEPNALFLNYYLFSNGFIVAAASKQLNNIHLYEYHDEEYKLYDIRSAIESEIKANANKRTQPVNWNSLSSIIISPVLPLLESGSFSKIIFIPDGLLMDIPFSAITFHDGALVDKYEVTQVPSASILYYLNSHVKEVGPSLNASLVFGNPTGDLKFAEEEAICVANTLGSTYHLGTACSKDTLSSNCHGAPVIHLACHGYFDMDVAERSGVLLAGDEIVSVSDLGNLRLNNSLVVLSACESGKLMQHAGSELVSLYVSLFEAGAASAIVSLWKVNDRSTMLLMQKVYEHWLAGHSIVASLRKAQIWLKADYPEYSHPFYWAPFVSIGADLRVIK
ncbi:MAG TPA: CHAT domain-containing tetratricopeptide repeat protein [Pyrinomonadaceae bacterium]|jgi:CHAT domain-containing protein